MTARKTDIPPDPNEHPVTAYRRAKGLTMDEFAARVGVSKPTISKIENGTMSLTVSMLRRIREAAGGEITAEALVNWQPPGQPAAAA